MVKFALSSEPPKASPTVESCVEACPKDAASTKQYQVEIIVGTRAANIALEGLSVFLDGTYVGNTDSEGKIAVSSLREQTSLELKVQYENSAERLKREVFTLEITDINADNNDYTVGKGKNFISKVLDVFGSGSKSLAGDLDFEDEYEYESGWVAMSDTADPDVQLLKIAVQMSTFSLQVPYLSQVGSGETLTTQAASASSPNTTTHNFKGSIICMPTSTTMLANYWDIKGSDGTALGRNELMQRWWDEHSYPTIN